MTAENGTQVTVDGSVVDLAALGTVTRTIGFECSSGRWIEHDWAGIPIDRLLSVGDVDPTATHVIVSATDGHTACVDLPAALNGMLALEQDGDRLAGPRFVSPSITGPRAVSDVSDLETIHLAPEDDPTSHESMDLVES